MQAQTLGSVDQADDRRSCQRSRSPLQLASGDGQLIQRLRLMKIQNAERVSNMKKKKKRKSKKKKKKKMLDGK